MQGAEPVPGLGRPREALEASRHAWRAGSGSLSLPDRALRLTPLPSKEQASRVSKTVKA